MPLFSSQLEQVRKVSSDVPDLIAPSAAIIDGATGKVLYAKNAHEHMAPASVTKMMTAIVAIENGRLSDVVTSKVNGWAMVGSSIMGLIPGETLPLEDLLYGLLLPSGNDAALAIAQHVGGTEEHFVQMMNDKAAELGLKDTHFVNPHGLDEDNHYSSAYDLAMIGRYAMQSPAFATIVATRTYMTRGSNPHGLVNGNRLLGQYKGLDGVKTGYTENAGQSYVATVNASGRRVFVGLIKSTDRYRDATQLFDYFFEDFAWVKLVVPKSPFYTVTSEDGTKHDIEVSGDHAEALPLWETPYIRSFVNVVNDGTPSKAKGGAEPNSPIGSATFYLGTDPIGELPVLQK